MNNTQKAFKAIGEQMEAIHREVEAKLDCGCTEVGDKIIVVEGHTFCPEHYEKYRDSVA